jgi:hypothetical protein
LSDVETLGFHALYDPLVLTVRLSNFLTVGFFES